MAGNRSAWMFAVVSALTACGDGGLNKNFQQEMKARDAAKAGDRYAALESKLPKQAVLTYRKKEEYRDYSNGLSGTFRSNYDSLLAALDADKTVDRKSALFIACRSAFTYASAYQSSSGEDAAVAASSRQKTLFSLKACRDSAKKAGDKGATLARFASTGIVMVGAKTVGQGDQEGGLRIWREGETFVGQDKPEFKLTAQSLRGY